MQVMMLTHSTAKLFFQSNCYDSQGNVLDANVQELLTRVIKTMGAIDGSDEKNVDLPYLDFIYILLKLHSKTYMKATHPDSAISTDHLNLLLGLIKPMWPNITGDDILTADKMDILYGTHYITINEHTKFSVWFYELVYSIASETVDLELLEDVYEETVRFIEVIMSTIEQSIIFRGDIGDNEDLVVLCLYPTVGAIYFFID